MKGDDDALSLQGTGILHNAFDDGLVSVMHTVESADGDDGIPKIWQMIQAAVYLHVGQKLGLRLVSQFLQGGYGMLPYPVHCLPGRNRYVFCEDRITRLHPSFLSDAWARERM